MLNLTAVKNAMDNPPKSNKIHLFFDGAISQLDEEQKLNLIDIIKTEMNECISFIEKSLELKIQE